MDEEEEFDDQRIEGDKNEWEKNLRDNDQHNNERPRSTENKEQKTISTIWLRKQGQIGHRLIHREWTMTTTHTSLQLPVPRDPAIAMIGLPRDEISIRTSNTHETIRPSYWSAFPETTSTSLTPRVRTSLTPRVRTSLNPRARTSLTPRSPRTRTSPTSLGTRTRTSPRKREHARTRHLQCLLDDQLQRRFPVLNFYKAALDRDRHDRTRYTRLTTATTPWRRIASIRLYRYT